MVVSLNRCACVDHHQPLPFSNECFLEDMGQSVFEEMKVTSTEMETGLFEKRPDDNFDFFLSAGCSSYYTPLKY